MHQLKIKKSDKGKFIILKKDYLVYKAVRGGIVQLLLPKGTMISVPWNYNSNKNRHNRKLRADQALVLGIVPVIRDGGRLEYQDLAEASKKFESKWASSFYYQIGKLVKPTKGLDLRSNNPCKSGIHFFCDLKDAEAWY